MIASAVRELSESKDPARVAAAFFEKTIQIWDLQSHMKVGEFPTVFCSRAGNLAFAPSAQIVVAGASERSGKVAAYEIPSGRLLWQRRVTYPSSLRFHPFGQSVLCSSNNTSILRLDARSGATVEVLKGSSQLIEGPYDDQLNVPSGRAPFRLLSRGREAPIPRGGIALLDARFSPDAVCLTEGRGPVRCINCADGSQRWQFDPGVALQPNSQRLFRSSTRPNEPRK